MATFDIKWNLTRRVSTPNPTSNSAMKKLYQAMVGYGFTPGDPVSEEAFYNEMMVKYPERFIEVFLVASGASEMQYAPGEAVVTLISDP